MDYDQMKAFLTVAETKNFTRAAELLYVTQSTITTRIKNLEKMLGKDLFKRTNRRVELTLTGQILLPYIQRSVELMEKCQMTARLDPLYEERLVVGSVHSLWDYFLGSVVHRFHQEHDRIALRLITGHSAEIAESVLDGAIDLGVVYLPPQNPEIEVILVHSEPFQLISSPHIFMKSQELTALDLTEIPHVYLDWGPSFSSWFHAEMGPSYLPSIEVDHAYLLMQLIIQGKGLGFVLHSVARPYLQLGNVVRVPYLAYSLMPRQTIYAIIHKRKTQDPLIHTWIR